MSSVLSLDAFALVESGPTLTLRLEPRQSMFVYGRSGAGKTRFLRSLTGSAKPARGTAKLSVEASMAGFDGAARKATPESIARRAAGHGGASRIAEALSALGLWDVRSAPIAELSEGQAAAAQLATPLASMAGLLVIDGQLDLLDPWTLRSVMDLLSKRVAKEASLCVATNRPEFMRWADLVVVWKDQRPQFAGSPAELARTGEPSKIEVRTLNRPSASGIAAPFSVRIEESAGGLTVRAESGHALAARLLLEGYGDVEGVSIAEPTFEDLLRGLG